MKKAASLVGTILMIASLFFVVLRFIDVRNDMDISILLSYRVLIPLIIVVLGEGITVIFASINFRNLITSVSGVVVNKPLAIKIYNNANMFKYIPGGLMYAIGRNQMAIETKGLSHSKVAISTILEGVLWVIIALILTSIFASNYAFIYFESLELPFVRLIITCMVLILAVVGLHFYLKKNNIDLANKVKQLNILAVLKNLPFMFLIVSLWGFSFLGTITILGQPFSFSLGITIVGLYIMSWVIGFLTPGSPSGLGIREVVLLMFLGDVIYEEILLTAIIIHRAIQILGDILAYIMAWVYFWGGRKWI